MGDQQKYNFNPTYINRRETLHKKLYEFCTLCDVEACMINFGPDNEIGTWPSDRSKVNAMIHDYKLAVAERKEKRKQSSNSSKNSSLLNYYETEKTNLQSKVNEMRMARFNKMCSAWSDKSLLGLPIETLRNSATKFDSKLALLEEKLDMLLMSNTATNSHQITTTQKGKRKRVENNTSRSQSPPPPLEQLPPQQQQLQPAPPLQQLQLQLAPPPQQQQPEPLPQQQQPMPPSQQQQPPGPTAVGLGYNMMVQDTQTPMFMTPYNYSYNNMGPAAAVMVPWPHHTSNGMAYPPPPTFGPQQPIPIMWMWPPQHHLTHPSPLPPPPPPPAAGDSENKLPDQ